MDSDFNYFAATPTDILKEKETSKAVNYAINCGYIDADKRLKVTRAAKKILLDF